MEKNKNLNVGISIAACICLILGVVYLIWDGISIGDSWLFFIEEVIFSIDEVIFLIITVIVLRCSQRSSASLPYVGTLIACAMGIRFADITYQCFTSGDVPPSTFIIFGAPALLGVASGICINKCINEKHEELLSIVRLSAGLRVTYAAMEVLLLISESSTLSESIFIHIMELLDLGDVGIGLIHIPIILILGRIMKEKND